MWPVTFSHLVIFRKHETVYICFGRDMNIIVTYWMKGFGAELPFVDHSSKNGWGVMTG